MQALSGFDGFFSRTLALVSLLLVCGCDGSVAEDAGVADCSGATDGTSCGEGRICVAQSCVARGCGDGFVDVGEECDDGNDESLDGCEPDCRFICRQDADCNDGNACSGTETCSANLCVAGTPLAEGAGCGSSSVCTAGRCVGAGCGNGLFEPEQGEECDDGANGNDVDGCTDTCGYSCAIWPGQTNVIGAVNGGFDDPSSYIAGPETGANWYGDPAAIAETEQGISPIAGRMLRFVNAYMSGPSANAGAGVRYAIDLTSRSEMVATGRLRANFSAHFNRVAISPTTDTEFRVELLVYDAQATLLELPITSFESDDNLDTWECSRVSVVLPTAATRLVVLVGAMENVRNDTTDPEYDGHYVDVAALWFTMDP